MIFLSIGGGFIGVENIEFIHIQENYLIFFLLCRDYYRTEMITSKDARFEFDLIHRFYFEACRKEKTKKGFLL